MAEYTPETPAPDGWRWTIRPLRDTYNDWSPGRLSFVSDINISVPRVESLFAALYAWSQEWECLIQDYGDPADAGARITVVRTVNVYPGMATSEHQARYWPPQWCRYGYNHGPNRTELTCTHGDEPEAMVDVDLSNRRTRIGMVLWTPEDNRYRDVNSVLRCPIRLSPAAVDARLLTGRYSSQEGLDDQLRRASRCGQGVNPAFSACTDCENRSTCARCEAVCQMNNGLILDNAEEFYCNSCLTFYCDNCDTWSEVVCQSVENQDGYFCSACRLTVQADRYELFDDEQSILPPTIMGLINNPHRPVRTCSIEMETVEGGQNLARVLTDAGLTEYAEVMGYHSSGSTESFCHVERDSSLGDSGGELVFDRIRLDEQDDVSRLHHAMGLVRQQIKAGQLQISLACGLHIHVDAHQFNVGDVRNLVLVTNYLEDAIYRLSAAKYKRHRGTDHAAPLPKGPFLDRRDFGVKFFASNNHGSSLNVEHYWNATRNNCRCGAVLYTDANECSCNLGKCTFEFRFFNGTANFRKVHAYAALCQSMVAYAKLMPDIAPDALVPQEYDGRHVGAGQTKKNKWDERLRWMLTNLYFAPNERESIRYCVDHSALAELGVERIESIFQAEYVVPDAPTQTIVHRNVRGVLTPDSPPLYGDSQYRENFTPRRRGL